MKIVYPITHAIFTLCLLFLLPKKSVCQSDCDILGIIDGTLNGWTGSGGTWHEHTNPDYVVYNNNTFYAIINGRHTVRNPSDGNVWWITAQNIPYVPFGDQHSIQLGNWDNGKQWERLTRTITVDSFNALLKLKIAVFLEDKGHTPIRQPKFWLKIYDQNGNLISCGDYQVEAGNIPGFLTQPKQTINGIHFAKIRYLPWTTVSADLREYLGENVTLEFTTFDCSEGEHFGCALFNIECQEAKITATPFCPAVSNSVTLSAPPGFLGYQWSNGATTQNITIQNPQPGQTFTVTFMPFSNLTGTCTISMSYTIPSAPQLSVPATVDRCAGDAPTEITAVGPTGYSYNWSNGSNNASTWVNGPGVLTVNATNSYCQLTATVQVNETVRPVFYIETVDAPCYGWTGAAYAVVDSLDSINYSYSWSNGVFVPANENIPAGVYTVTVTNNSVCPVIKSATIAQPNPIDFYPSFTPDYCNQQIASITLNATGDFPPYLYQLGNLPAQTSSVFTNLQAGTYSIGAIDSKGCHVNDSVFVVNILGPTISIANKNNTICGKDNGYFEIALDDGTSPFLYKLQGGAPQSADSFSMLSPGIYEIVVTDSAGCTDNTEIEILSSTAPVIQNVQPFSTTCDLPNGEIVITASGGKHPLEFGGIGIAFQPSNVLDGIAAGDFWVLLQDQDGCKDSLLVEIPAIPSPSLQITTTPTTCGLDNAEIQIVGQGGVGALMYSLNGSDFLTQTQFSNIAPGHYTISVEDAEGCQRTQSIEIPESKALVIDSVGKDLVECRKQNGMLTVVASGGSGERLYSLDFGQYQESNYFHFLAPKDYWLSVKDEAGCADSTWVILESDCVYVPNVFSPNDDGWNDLFQIFAKDNAVFNIVSYQIFDRWGGLVYEFEDSPTDSAPWWNGRINNSDKIVLPGVFVYCIKVETGDPLQLVFKGDVTLIR